MKKLIVGIIAVMAISGCDSWVKPYPNQTDAPYDNIRIKEIDGCQYIMTTAYSDGSGHRAIVHKGNCKNPMHTKWKRN